MFIDRAKIKVKAGNGGNGVIAFRRESYVPHGGPDGGNGGNGGSVYLVADRHLHTLLDFHYKTQFAAERGRQGSGSRSSGRSGKDIEIKVPVGTRIYENQELIVDLTTHQERILIAQGGRGGRGNAEFATSTNQSPRIATDGSEGEEKELLLELMLMADVGLVGLPNAGKSTLLSVLTAARPKIAPYPFTTLQPNLGIVRPTEYTSFVIADIPGLIEGASDGKGLGFDFLRHIERTRALVFLIDAASETPKEDYKILKSELKKWNPDLVKRPALVALSRCDLLMKKAPKGPWTLEISSANGEGLEELIRQMWDLLQAAPPPELFRPPSETIRRSKGRQKFDIDDE